MVLVQAALFDGCIESVHSAGHYLAVAVAPPDNAPELGMGSLHILDFTEANSFATVPSKGKGTGSSPQGPARAAGNSAQGASVPARPRKRSRKAGNR